MKNLLLTSILVLTFSVNTFAQTNETSPCPTVSIASPFGVVESGQSVTFSAELSKEANKFKPAYNWTVSAGEIVEGQGTLTIKVLQKEFKEGLSATIEITGFPKDCPNTFTETAVISNGIFDIFPVDLFGTMTLADEKVRLQAAISQLEKGPDFIALFVINFTKKEGYSAVNSRVAKITNLLTKTLRVSKDKFKFAFAESDVHSTTIYILPKDFSSGIGLSREELEKLRPQNKKQKKSLSKSTKQK